MAKPKKAVSLYLSTDEYQTIREVWIKNTGGLQNFQSFLKSLIYLGLKTFGVEVKNGCNMED